MPRGYQIFARSQKFRDNFDHTFRGGSNSNPCKSCKYLKDNLCFYDGDCLTLEEVGAADERS